MGGVSRSDWVVLLLGERALDRIRLMKALFLIWHRMGRPAGDFFEFVPYMYGPCSFELYTVLGELERGHLASQAPHDVTRWAPYYLTLKGEEAAQQIRVRLDPETIKRIKAIVSEVADMSFDALLQRVYAEAPDFAARSVVNWRN